MVGELHHSPTKFFARKALIAIMTADSPSDLKKKRYQLLRLIRPFLGGVVGLFLIYRLYVVLIVEHAYGPDTWTRLLIAGLILGGVYSLIAIGYTLVYGILFMINFAHGEVMMIGAFGGFFVFEALNALKVGAAGSNFLNTYPYLSIIFAFLAGMTISATTGFFLEKIAYRPLRKAPRLVPLISAIGASIFLQNAVELLFSSQLRNYTNPNILTRGEGWTIVINHSNVILPYTGVFSFVLSAVLLIIVYTVVKKTRLGRAMRAVALDKKTAALMGVDVDQTISRTFILSGILAGAAGVMFGIHNGLVYYYTGFVPGIKAFTAAVLGGIGNLPGAMLGGLFLGVVESMGPAALGIDFQLKDVLAFGILIIVLIFKPSGLLGESLAEEKV
jgi:branched-chain amino acid transport system permease protein